MNAEYLASVLLSVFLRSTLLIAAVGIATLVLRRKSASVRHGVLVVSLACLFVLPVLPFAGPRWTLPYQMSQPPVVTSALQYASPSIGVSGNGASVATDPSVTVASPSDSSLSSSYTSHAIAKQSAVDSALAGAPGIAEAHAAKPESRVLHMSWQFWVLAIWTVGFLVLLLRLMLSHVAAWRLTKQQAPGQLSLASELTSCVGTGRIIVSDRVEMPMTWGIAPALVLLPTAAGGWTDTRLRAVLLHERAHIDRRDWLVQVISEVARAAYWPHPFVWLLVRQLRLEAEMAADNAVLASGLAPSAYAGELIECVRQARHGGMGLATVAMADRHAMSTRVHSVLDKGASREHLRSRAAIAVAVVGLALTVTVGAKWTEVASTDLNSGPVIPGKTAWMTCTLVYPNTRPASDATFFLYYVNTATGVVTTATYRPDENGVVKFPVVVDPSIHVRRVGYITSPSGCAFWRYLKPRPLTACVLEPLTSLRIHLVDLAGKPIVGVRVSPRQFTSNFGSSEWYDAIPSDWRQTTDSNGIVTLSNLPQGADVSVNVFDDQYARPDISSPIQLRFQPITPDATLKVAPASSITGTVVFRATNKPVFHIMLAAEKGFNTAGAYSDKDGHFTISRLASGTYSVWAVGGRGDFEDWVGPGTVVHVGVGALASAPVIRLDHGSIVEGKISDRSTGKAVPNVNVAVISSNSAGECVFPNDGTSGADGMYTVRTVPGNLNISTYSEVSPNADYSVRNIAISEGQTKVVNFGPTH